VLKDSRVALVTGAASGIGRAISHTFVKEGCTRLLLGDIDDENLDAVSQELRSINPAVQTMVRKVDIASESEVQDFINAGVSAFGGIHYAVNNVGITSNPRARTHKLEASSFDPLVAVNLRGTWLCQRAEIRQMMKQNAELRPRFVLLTNPLSFFQRVFSNAFDGQNCRSCAAWGHRQCFFTLCAGFASHFWGGRDFFFSHQEQH
jgi:NAD(P)-dependent dehydrogenase (short-subunit alcohol dehydrogenase family)